MTEEKQEEKIETIYKVVQVPSNYTEVVEYPDGKRYTFEAALMDILERLHKIESKVG